MLCSRCKKRTAVVFVSSPKNSSETEGFCIQCAKEMGIKPLEEMISKMGISEEEISGMQEQFDEIMDVAEKTENDSHEESYEEDEDESFEPGGAATFPFVKSFFTNMLFPNRNNSSNDAEKNSPNTDPEKPKKKSKRRHLNLYCTNLTGKAKDGKLDRIIGRDTEINRAIQILCRRTKNNPCFIGEPGVGKTAIAEGLAMKIVAGEVPYRMKNKELFLLDLTSLVAGTQFRGQFESRIKGLIDEVKKEGNIILFIDEVHNLVGTGDSEGSMSAANILKPALSRGEIQVIGATTFAEYRKYIEKDAALERRFQSIKISEPSVTETITVLKGVKDYYEDHHRVKVSDDLIRKLVVFSERYITDRFLPDKAIDLLDESCTYAALKNKELSRYDELIYEDEKLKKDEEDLVAKGEEADYKQLAEIRCKLAKHKDEIDSIKGRAINADVVEADVAHVIELWTGIPASKIRENEFEKLESLEESLNKKIIGQSEAVKAVSSAIKRNRIQISPRRRPASFIFVGSTGVGKTELVKVLAEELFDSPEALIRLDMSEYMEKHSVSKMVGSPPGYVGYDESGQLTEKVRQRPYSVVLLDEIEKAHPDIMNLLLQVLDEGKVTDSHGRTINFENTIIIMTSNAGSNKKDGSLGFAKTENELVKEKVIKALKEFLRPEFISRVDDVVVFNKLTKNDYISVAKLMIDEYVSSLNERGVTLKYDKKALEKLAEKSIDGSNGARDLRNLIRKEVEDKLSDLIIKNGGFDLGEVTLTANSELELKISK